MYGVYNLKIEKTTDPVSVVFLVVEI
jgi:hypothetical protein